MEVPFRLPGALTLRAFADLDGREFDGGVSQEGVPHEVCSKILPRTVSLRHEGFEEINDNAVRRNEWKLGRFDQFNVGGVDLLVNHQAVVTRRRWHRRSDDVIGGRERCLVPDKHWKGGPPPPP